MAALLRDAGADTETLDADISREDEMEAAVARLVKRFGRPAAGPGASLDLTDWKDPP